MANPSELVYKLQRGELPPPPIAKLIGFDLVLAERGHTRFSLDASERHANPMGTLHGGVLCDLADAAMGMAHATTLEEGETFTTLELKINFLRPVWNARLYADARVVHYGKTISLVECDVTTEDGKPVAKVSSTVMTLRGEKARGR
jgi:uncharacterized protein (TIGR00369 family)